jgi:hypothetical protein
MKILNYSKTGKLIGVERTKKRKLVKVHFTGVIEVPREEVWERPYIDENHDEMIKMRIGRRYAGGYRAENPTKGRRLKQIRRNEKIEKKDTRHGVYVPTILSGQIARKAKKKNGKVVVKEFGKIVFKKKGRKMVFLKRVKK